MGIVFELTIDDANYIADVKTLAALRRIHSHCENGRAIRSVCRDAYNKGLEAVATGPQRAALIAALRASGTTDEEFADKAVCPIMTAIDNDVRKVW